jgi:hypothetical protein
MKRVLYSLFLTTLLMVGSSLKKKSPTPFTISALTANGGWNNKTASTSWTFAYSVGVTAGRTYFLAIACDNLGTADGDNGDVTSVSDNAGNTFTKAAEFTNGQGGAASGATVSVWYCSSMLATTTSNSITVNFSGSPAAKAANGYTTTITSGNVIGVDSYTTRADDNLDPGSMSFSSGTSRQYLLFRAMAVENTAVNPTATSGWSTSTASGSSGGGAASNMMIGAENLISTTTSATSDPTVVAADCASLLIGFYEYTPAPLTRRITYID